MLFRSVCVCVCVCVCKVCVRVSCIGVCGRGCLYEKAVRERERGGERQRKRERERQRKREEEEIGRAACRERV